MYDNSFINLKQKTVEKYATRTGDSGITAFETGADYIIVQFIGGDKYRYTYRSAGKRHIEKMKQLATDGKGLSTYISQHIRGNYQDKLS